MSRLIQVLLEEIVEIDLSHTGLVTAVIVAIALGALLKGITGAGLPLLAVPMLASITTVEDAVVLLVLPGIAANAWLVMTHHRFRTLLKDHIPFLLAGFLGGIAGTWLLSWLDDHWLKLVLIAWLGLYLYQYFFHRETGERLVSHKHFAIPLGLTAGTVQGASGISAPLVAPYYHARGLRKQAYAFSLGFTFLLFSIGQFAAMTQLDLLTPERLTVSALAIPPTILFIWLGIRWSHRISESLFNRLILGLFIAMEIKLVFDVVSS